MRPLSRREIIRRFRKLGFEGPRTRSDHQYMSRGKLKVKIPNPHGSQLSIGFIRQLLREAGITPEEWDAAE